MSETGMESHPLPETLPTRLNFYNMPPTDHSVFVPISSWFSDEQLELEFPKGWNLRRRPMVGESRPALSDDSLLAAIRNPLGTLPIQALAAERRQAVILFDDLTRPTPAWRVAPIIVDELRQGGMKDDQIRFMASFGGHIPMSRPEFILKLGEGIVNRFPVYNHNCHQNLVKVGVTSLDTPLLVNREVMSCDLKIGLGGCIPYWKAGNYGGGAKIVLPGVCGLETIHHHHMLAPDIAEKRRDPRLGKLEDGGRDALRLNMEEAARMVGLDFKVDCVLNEKREVVKLFAGDPGTTWDKGRQYGNQHYVTDPGPKSEADIVVINTYPQEEQPSNSLGLAVPGMKEGGDVVVLSHCPKGLVMPHYMFGRWGSEYGGCAFRDGMAWDVPQARRVFVISPYVLPSEKINAASNKKVRWYSTWEEALPELQEGHQNGTKVNLFPYAAIQTIHSPALDERDA